MSQVETLTVRKGHPAWWAALRFFELGFRLALAALGLLVLAVIAYFVYEWAYPPPPVNPISFFGSEEGRRAPRFLTKSFSYAAYILFIAALLKNAAAFACVWVDERGRWKLVAAVALFFFSGVLYFLGNLSCGCAVEVY